MQLLLKIKNYNSEFVYYIPRIIKHTFSNISSRYIISLSQKTFSMYKKYLHLCINYKKQRKMKKISILLMGLIVLGSMFFSSCNKDDDDNNTTNTPTSPVETKSFAKEIKNNGFLVAKFEYTNNLLTKSTSYDTTGASAGYETFEYINNVASLFKNYDKNEDLEYKLECEISNNKIVKRKVYYDSDNDDNLDYVSYDTIYYNDNKISKVEGFSTSTGEKYYYTTYTWSGNNITEVKSYFKDYSTNQFILSYTDTYVFDTKKNPLYNIGIGELFVDATNLSENNVTKQTNVSAYNNETTVYESVIEYNSKSYPTKVSETNTTTNKTETTEYVY